jgi:hypothetical protein
MTYEELMSLVGGSNPQSATYQDIISGIQSQYRPQTQFAPTRSLLDSMGTTVADQPRIAYGALLQGQGQKKITPIDLAKYQADSEGMSGGIYDGGGGGDSGASNAGGGVGFSINADGVAVPNTVSQTAATALGLATGLPIGLAISAINAQNVAAANAANAAMAAADIDSTSIGGVTATSGATGTGAAAAAAGSAAAAAASAAGASDAAAAAAGQAAANAAIGGASAADAAAAGAAAAAATDGGGDSAGDGGAGATNGSDNGGGEGGTSDGGGGSADGSGWAKGGLVTMNRLMGSNPMGQDDGYGALQHGEYVIKKDAVNKYGEEFLGLLNSGKLTKKQINSLL